MDTALCSKKLLGKRIRLSSTHSALQTKGLLNAVWNAGVPWCRFTRNPGIEGGKLQSLHKKVLQETWGGKKKNTYTQTKR